jgi:nicotinamide phosphoribosyltransferase
MKNINPFLCVDGYKIHHGKMSPKGTTMIYSNFTPRSAKYAPKGCNEVLVFGTQMTIREIVSNFEDNFFMSNMRLALASDDYKSVRARHKFEVCQDIKREYSMYSNTDYDVSKIEALWDLGYLPIKVKALPEGTFCPMGVPVLTIYNTLPEFAWVTNFLETMISNLLWKPMTSATLGYEFKKLNDKWIAKTDQGNDFHSQFGCHDFSMRGMDSLYATMSSGLGHAVSFLGSDSLPVIHAAREYYDEKEFVIGSIPATEHSIQCAYYHEDGTDYNYVKTLIERFPTGPLGIVADGFDLWKLITEVLPQLKEQIMSRTGGPVVIRPDSGDPADIICGNPDSYIGSKEQEEGMRFTEYAKNNPASKGVIELLWDIFGGTINTQGYKVLHPSIKMIYGDAINLERFEEINTRLEAKGFASTNWIAGIGSFTYQFNTRDTFGFAMKSTYQEVSDYWDEGIKGKTYNNPKGIDIFKDPVTDDGTKKSAKGLLKVITNQNNIDKVEYQLVDQVSWHEEMDENKGHLQTIFKNGEFSNQVTLTEIRDKINKL